MSFFVKAFVMIKEFSSNKLRIQKEEIVYKNYYNISIAVGTDSLVVPVLRQTDEMSFAEIEKT